MEKISSMVSMARTPQEKEQVANNMLPTAMNQPDYPYGLSISLGEDELEKLGFGDGELCVDDLVHLHCMAVVTSTSSNNSSISGSSCRVEMQITHIQAEDEDEENEEADEEVKEKRDIPSKLYKAS